MKETWCNKKKIKRTKTKLQKLKIWLEKFKNSPEDLEDEIEAISPATKEKDKRENTRE